MTLTVSWIAASLLNIADVWSVVWLAIRYGAQFGFVISAIGFFVVAIRKISRFVDEQQRIGDHAKSFADATNKILASLVESKNEHATRLAVIEDRVGIGMEYHGEERRHRPHRKGDPEKRRGDDV